jgi:hypothetical protein
MRCRGTDADLAFAPLLLLCKLFNLRFTYDCRLGNEGDSRSHLFHHTRRVLIPGFHRVNAQLDASQIINKLLKDR